MKTKPPRLVLYGIGQYGQMMARFAHKKGWPIVAAFNRAGSKVGQDLGRLAGLGMDLGVVVQDCDKANFAELRADAAIVTLLDKLEHNFPAHRRLLDAGLNVVCHGSESYYPQMADPAIAEQIDAVAKANNVTFTGTGVWDMSRIWAALTACGVCDEIQSLTNTSLTILDPFGERILSGLGIGKSREWFSENIAGAKALTGGHFYRFGPALVLHGLGYTPTDSSHRQEPIMLEKSFYCAALERELPAGSCAGLRAVAQVNTKEGITATAVVESRIRMDDSEVEYTTWQIKGDPLSPTIRIERDNGHYMHALSVFNRVTDTIAAPPGIQLLTQLGPMRHLANQ